MITDDWPIWAAITVAILIQLKGSIKLALSQLLPAHFGHLAKLETKRQGFEQDKEMALLEARLEESRTARQSQLFREDRQMELLEEYHKFAQGLVTDDLRVLRSDILKRFDHLETLYERNKRDRETTQSKLFKLIEKD